MFLEETEYQILFESDDVGWMKAPMVNGINAGFIRNTVQNQQFMSYQSETEHRNGFTDTGLVRTGDLTDPWTGELDVTWRKDMYDKHFTGQVPISYVRNSYVVTDKIKTWTSDIYGYSYGILKEDDEDSIYKSKINKERFTPGKLYIRRNDGAIDELKKYILTGLRGENAISDDEFYAIDMCYDVLILIGTKRVVFYKLTYDENIEKSFKIVDDLSNANIINLGGNFFSEFTPEVSSDPPIEVNARCAGVWIYPDKSIIDAVYLAWYKFCGYVQYFYIIDSMDTTTFVHKHKKYVAMDDENYKLVNLDKDSGIVLETLNVDDDAKFDLDKYVIIGPVLDHANGIYTSVFQLRGDGTAKDKIGRFIRTQIDPVKKTAHWEMVKKVDFDHEDL